MLNAVMSLIILYAAPGTGPHCRFEAGPLYNYNLLWQDNQAAKGLYAWAGEIGLRDLLPGIGLKLRASYLKLNAPDIDSTAEDESRYAYRYIPMTLTSVFNLLPFRPQTPWSLSLETGLGACWWQGLYDDEVLEIPTGRMDEKDLEFTAGLNLQIRPRPFLGLELTSRFHYLTSANLEKYGYSDKDEKLLENGLGIKFIFPTR